MDTTKKDPERGKKYKYKVHDNLFVRQITMCSLRLKHLTSFPVKRLTAKGQLISKAIFVFLTSSKKQTKKI